jgi:HD-GYP domain-containing protein (c-di-GMP phosphodiesterase class II)
MKILIVTKEQEIAEILSSICANFVPSENITQTNKELDFETILKNPFNHIICYKSSALIDFLKKSQINTHLIFFYEQEDEIISVKSIENKTLIQSKNLYEGLKTALEKKEEKPAQKLIGLHRDLFFKQGYCPCDIFLQLSGQKHIKLFSQGDILNAFDKIKLVEKNIEKLYIDESDLNNFANNIIQSLNSLNERKKTLFSQNYAHHYDGILSIANEIGFNSTVIESAKNAIENFVKNIEGTTLFSHIEFLLKDNMSYLAKQSSIATYLSCIIAKNLTWTSHITYHKLTMACYLANCTLPKIELTDMTSIHKIENDPTHPKRKAYERHILEAAKIARTFTEVPQDVEKIILEHHEKPDGSGFPKKSFHTTISPLGSIVIVSMLVSDWLIAKQSQKQSISEKEIATELRQLGFDKGNFKKIIDTLEMTELF